MEQQTRDASQLSPAAYTQLSTTQHLASSQVTYTQNLIATLEQQIKALDLSTPQIPEEAAQAEA